MPETELGQGFEDWLRGPTFSCLGARVAANRDALRSRTYFAMSVIGSLPQLHDDLALSAESVTAGTLVPRRPETIAMAIDELTVAEHQGALAAVIGLGRRGDDLLIYNFCVGDALRGRGVGAQLVAFAAADAKREGCGALIAFGDPDDDWFERQGFDQIDDRHLDPARLRLRTPGRDSVLYERRIGPDPGRR